MCGVTRKDKTRSENITRNHMGSSNGRKKIKEFHLKWFRCSDQKFPMSDKLKGYKFKELGKAGDG